MYKIGITGTLQGVTGFQDAAVALYIQQSQVTDDISKREIEFHHGMAVGVDEFIGNTLHDEGFTVIGHPGVTLKGIRWKRGNCRVYEEREEKPYIERNYNIVDETNELWAFPKERNTRRPDCTWTPIRSGTWATIRYAESKGKKVVIFWPDGDIEVINDY